MEPQLRALLYSLPGLILGFTVHEWAHAAVAVAFGDQTPRAQGRLSLNPLRHIDPIGFIMIAFAGFGWAKPVQIDPSRFRRRSGGSLLVALAGPFANLVLGFLCMLALEMLARTVNLGDIAIYLLYYGAQLNFALFVFNLFPLPPLDGSWIVRAALSDGDAFGGRARPYLAIYMKYGTYLLIGLFFLEFALRRDIFLTSRLSSALMGLVAQAFGAPMF
jgi:Zn-dependent protease